MALDPFTAHDAHGPFNRGQRQNMKPRPFIVPLFIPHRGCPHRCVFCNQTSITGLKDGIGSRQEVRDRIRAFLAFRKAHRGTTEVAFYGGNFLGLPRDYRNLLLEEAQGFVERGQLDGIRFSTRPDTVTAHTLEEVAPYSVTTIEVGAQSMNDTVLALSRRGHTGADTERAVAILRACHMQVGLQIMPGLPGATPETILETGLQVAALRPDFVRIYPTVVVTNTVLEKWYQSGRFTPLSLPEAVALTKRLYRLFTDAHIVVIRMGLQPSSSLRARGQVVAGPFHPAFGHLVHSAHFLDLATEALASEKRLPRRVTVKVHPPDVPKLVGQKRENIKRLVARFHLERLQVLPDETVAENTVEVVSKV
ncbi:MAG: radical SAM protein [Thermodesulfobacteriota bacterium]|nr:radical SAM protein [Thermodesulfobacteriota bacterium]